METVAKLHSLTFREHKTYLFASVFIIGNLLLPQLCHLVPGGGLTWLPIYFFTLIAAYKYGLRVGIITAILSPLLNYMLFDMPTLAGLPIILIKSSLLAVIAAFAARRFGKISIPVILSVVITYQIIGAGIEWLIFQDQAQALLHLRMAVPGMLVQVAGGFLILKTISKR